MELTIDNLRLSAIIGILESEKTMPQPLIFTLRVGYAFSASRPPQYLDYTAIVRLVEERVSAARYELLEDALPDITQHLKTHFPAITKITICAQKPHAVANALVGVRLKTKFC